MNACQYGIPQNRKRWYCVGFRNNLKIGFEGQKEAYKAFYQFPVKRELKYTVNDVIEDNVGDEYKATEICKRNIETYLKEFIKTERYNEQNVLLESEVRASRCNFRCDGISPCLTAKMGTGGNNVPIVVKKGRKLTEKECLKIMGFPDWYDIDKNSMHSYKQIGNSVVVSIVTELAKEMVRVLK